MPGPVFRGGQIEGPERTGSCGRSRAESLELVGKLEVTVDERDFDRRASPRAALLGERAHNVDALLSEQGDPVPLVVDDRPGEQAP